MSRLAQFRKHALIGLLVAIWIPAIGFGINKLVAYSTTPGRAAEPPEMWPRKAPVERVPGKFTLLMFTHPQCECTQASLGELAIIMAHSADRAAATVLFFEPSQEPAEWTHSDLWKTAAAIPSVHAAEDRNAEIAQAFGVFTSGQTLLYDPDGRLIFKGGITASRGHSGDNAGRSAITAMLLGNIPRHGLPITTRTFGCSLRGE